MLWVLLLWGWMEVRWHLMSWQLWGHVCGDDSNWAHPVSTWSLSFFFHHAFLQHPSELSLCLDLQVTCTPQKLIHCWSPLTSMVFLYPFYLIFYFSYILCILHIFIMMGLLSFFINVFFFFFFFLLPSFLFQSLDMLLVCLDLFIVRVCWSQLDYVPVLPSSAGLLPFPTPCIYLVSGDPWSWSWLSWSQLPSHSRSGPTCDWLVESARSPRTTDHTFLHIIDQPQLETCMSHQPTKPQSHVVLIYFISFYHHVTFILFLFLVQLLYLFAPLTLG